MHIAWAFKFIVKHVTGPLVPEVIGSPILGAHQWVVDQIRYGQALRGAIVGAPADPEAFG